jgi:hypothetical protein
MGYQTAHYYKHGDTNNCVSYTMYVPDGGNLRSQISQQYVTLFGRWGESGGVEGWVTIWNSADNGGFSSVYAMVLSGAGGELNGINANGKHTGLSTGGCPVGGCTDSTANNTDSNADFDDGSCTYDPPTVTLTATPSTIKLGDSSNIKWVTTGNANKLVWLKGNINNTLITSNKNVTPTSTTIYQCKVTGAGGSTTKSVTVTVNSPPTGEISVPSSVDYGDETFDIEWEAKYANTKQNLRITTIDLDGNNDVTNISLTPKATSAETGAAATATERDGTYTYTPSWGPRGPSEIRFSFELGGDGGSTTLAREDVLVDIDQTPDNIAIPGTIDVLKGDPDIRSPEEGTATSDLIQVNDIDIPVEIIASNPILVRIDNTGEWTKLRSYGVPAEPVGGIFGIFDGPEEEEEFVEKPSEAVKFEQIDETIKEVSNDFRVVEADPIIVKTTADTLVLNSGSFTIDPDIAYVQFKIWGGGGAGENVNDSVDPFIRTSGGDGAASTFLGLTAGGGNKGKRDVVDAGKGGIATDDYGWGSRGVSLTMVSGTNSQSYAFPTISNITNNGGGAGRQLGNAVNGGGGNGSTGARTYTSSSYHVFDNANNVHNFSQSGSSADISLSYVNPGAPDGLTGSRPTNGKYYNLSFITPYVNNSWSFSVSGVCNQAAGGGTGKGPYTYQGYRYKSSSGISLWFQNGNAINGYIRCFTISTTGLKVGVIGMGGGGGAAISGTITRAQFQASETYALGTTHNIVSGGGGQTAGIAGVTPANDGGSGRIELYVVYRPKIEFYSISAPAPDITAPYTVEIKKGECVTFSWRTIGDADTFVWTAGNISNTLLTSTVTVCPEETTEYTARANGLGGFSDFFTLTVNVFELPTGSVDAPDTINYGVETFDIEYTVNYANIANTIDVIYLDIDNVSTVMETIDLEVTNTALANADPIDYTRTETLSYTPTWGDRGPGYIQFRLNVEGDGGTQQFPDDGGYYSIFVVIDQTPDNIIIPDSLDEIKDDPDIRSPEEGTVTSNLILVNDIDIPVEIKASNPILVRTDNVGEWTQLRSYGALAEPVGFDGPEEEEEFVEETVSSQEEFVEEIVEETVSTQEEFVDLEVIEADPESVTTQVAQAFNSNGGYAGSIQIPSNAINVRVDLAAARGGGGGSDANGAGGAGGAGRRANIYFPNFTARRLDFYLGNEGGNAGSGGNRAGASGGSSSAASGGTGGNSADNGSSGAGGGGGGASGIFDTFSNTWVAVCGGGGGGGGGALGRPGIQGGTGTGLQTGNPSNRTVGGTGQKNTSEPSDRPDGSGGGGGGGGCVGGAGGAYGVDQNRGGVGGGGGQSGYNSTYCSFNNNSGTQNAGAGFANVYYDLQNPSITSFTCNPAAIIRGQSTTLQWSTSFADSASINQGVGAVAVGSNKTTSVSPNSTTTYTLTACFVGICVTADKQVIVYEPPTVNFYADKYYIKRGETVTLYWITSGDGSTLTWISANITNTLLSSQSSVTPTITTTYTLQVSGLGGTSPQYSVEIVVYEPPEGEFNAPSVIDYGTVSFNVTWEAKYANTKVRFRITTIDLDDNNVVTNVDLPLANSAESGKGPDNDTSGTYTHTPSWGPRGPSLIRFSLELSGDGGSETIPSQDVFVNIDQTPDNIIIPESLDLIKDDPDVRSPEGDIVSDYIQVNDIDIPVEIRASNPILVDINQDNNWTKIRSYGPLAEPVGGIFGIFDGPKEEEEFVEETVSSRSVPVDIEVIEADPDTVKTSNHEDVDYTNLVTCISIIDESSPAVSTHQSDWTSFRNNYPNRTFYLLQATFRTDPPQGNPSYGLNVLNRPSNFLNDPYSYTVQVNRDDETSNISNWFNICGLQNVPAGSYVSVWLDISGSMRAVDVQRSYNAFETACSNAGIVIVLETSDSGERWIPGHNKDLPPSGFITADKTSVKEDEEFELTWVAFGEVTQVTITNYNGGNPVSFTGHADLTISVTTTFTMSIQGTTGTTQTRSVTVTVIPKPVFNIWLLNDTNIQETVRKPNVNTQINWATTPAGSGTTLTWSSGNIANTLLTSQTSVQLSDSSTFCGTVTGPGGTSDTVCATIIVSQYVTLEANAPGTIDYNTETITLDYSTEYSDVEMKLEVFFTYLDGSTSPTSVFTDDTLPHPDSFELNPVAPAFNSVDDQEIEFDMSTFWSDIGPSSIKFRFTATGSAGTEVLNLTTLVNIDRTPNNILIPDSLGLIKDDPDVRSPLDGATTDMLLVDDIDVPVEISSDYEIKVRVNNTGGWVDVRNVNP